MGTYILRFLCYLLFYHFSNMIPPHEIHLWHADVPQGELDTSTLAESEVAKAAKFMFARDRQRFLATRILVRQLLAEYAQVAPEQITFTQNDYGKPRIAGPQSATGLHFNVSHTTSKIVCGVTTLGELGVDIESRVPAEHGQLADRNFSPEECQWYGQAEDISMAKLRFLTVWTLKEAYIKAVGKGLSIPLTSFSIIPQGEASAKLVRCLESNQQQEWYFKRWMLEPAISMALAIPCQRDVKLQIRLQQYDLSPFCIV